MTSASISATRRLHATDPEKYVEWLRAQISRAEQALAKAREAA